MKMNPSNKNSKYNNKNSQHIARRGSDDFSNMAERMFAEFGMGRMNMGISNFFNEDRDFGNFARDFGDFDDNDDDMFSSGMGMSSNMRLGGSNQGIVSKPQGTVFTKSYSSSVKYDHNGVPQKEVYSSQSMSAIDDKGKKISEKQSAYQNSKTREEKAAHEKILDNKGKLNTYLSYFQY